MSEIPTRSWCEQGFLQIQVSGDQELLGSPVMFSLSCETLSESCSSPAQVVVCLQGVDTISRLAVFSKLFVFEIFFSLRQFLHILF